MRKLLSIVALMLVAITASAQLSFVCDGKEVASGSTFTSSKMDDEYVEIFEAIKFAPDVKVKSSLDETVCVKVKSLTNDQIQFCYGGNCIFVGSSPVTRSADLYADEPVSLQIDAMGAGLDSIVTYRAEIVAYVQGQEATTSISLNLVMTNDNTILGVNNIEASHGKVTFANGTLSYGFATSAPRTITLYTLSGSTVASYGVAGTKGTLSLADLQPGVYAYAVGCTELRGKILVK